MNMTDEEKQEIVEMLYRKMELKIPKNNWSTILSGVRERWFGPNIRESKIGQHISYGPWVWEIWEYIRKTTLHICGVSRLKQLEQYEDRQEYAVEVAEKLCALIYELAKGNSFDARPQ